MTFLSKVLLLLVTAYGIECACPNSCTCTGDVVTCVGLNFIPGEIDRSAREVSLEYMILFEVPSNVFFGFNNLRTCRISNSIIQTVRSYAFWGPNATSITFNRCDIKTVESRAFWGSDNLEGVVFVDSSIERFESLAVTNIGYLGGLFFTMTNVSSFADSAITGIGTLRVLGWMDCTVGTMGSKAVSSIDEIEFINIMRSNITALEMKAFWNITKVNLFTLHAGNISEMKSYAISNLGSINSLQFTDQYVGVMRRYAVFNITDAKSLSWLQSQVDVFESFAVSNVKSVETLNVVYTKIGHLQSFAFFNTSVGRSVFNFNTIDRIDCGTVEYLNNSSSFPVALSDTNVTCDKNICWMFHPNRTEYLRTILSGIECSTPHPNVTSGLGSLYGMPVKELPFGCSGYGYSADFTCLLSGEASTHRSPLTGKSKRH